MAHWIARLVKHRLFDEDDARRLIGKDALARIEARVAASEKHHSGEIRVVVEAGLPFSYLRRQRDAARPRRQAVRQARRLGHRAQQRRPDLSPARRARDRDRRRSRPEPRRRAGRVGGDRGVDAERVPGRRVRDRPAARGRCRRRAPRAPLRGAAGRPSTSTSCPTCPRFASAGSGRCDRQPGKRHHVVDLGADADPLADLVVVVRRHVRQHAARRWPAAACTGTPSRGRPCARCAPSPALSSSWTMSSARSSTSHSPPGIGVGQRAFGDVGQVAERRAARAGPPASATMLRRREHAVADEVGDEARRRPVVQRVGVVPLLEPAVRASRRSRRRARRPRAGRG